MNLHVTLIHCNFFLNGSKKYQVTFEPPPQIFMVSKPLNNIHKSTIQDKIKTKQVHT